MQPIIYFRNSQDNLEEYQVVSRMSEWQTYNRLLKIPRNSLVIGRYSVLPYYVELVEELKIIDSQLINSYEQHRYVADIENWYADLKDYTPETWFNWYNLSEGSYVVKGKTNSRKMQWNRQMFCKTKADISTVANSLMDDTFIRDQGLCVRQYIPLRQFGTGINGLPITNEWRIFCHRNHIVEVDYYWANDPDCKPYDVLPPKACKLLNDVISIIYDKINFYVIDIAETEKGEWIVIELNDGQMSGLSMINPDNFYQSLKNLINMEISMIMP